MGSRPSYKWGGGATCPLPLGMWPSPVWPASSLRAVRALPPSGRPSSPSVTGWSRFPWNASTSISTTARTWTVLGRCTCGRRASWTAWTSSTPRSSTCPRPRHGRWTPSSACSWRTASRPCTTLGTPRRPSWATPSGSSSALCATISTRSAKTAWGVPTGQRAWRSASPLTASRSPLGSRAPVWWWTPPARPPSSPPTKRSSP
mmetsp:Transcript_103486/g.178286  ORF Transcript_103486/g.178286 Transcript_103486/m.178286 type:complete len:203 (+) Transcript_103486:3151-3759(+)